MHKPNEIHPLVLRKPADDIAKPLSTIFEKLWQSGEVSDDGKKGNITLIFKKGKVEDPGYYTPDSLTSVPGKTMKEFLLETMLRHTEKKEVIGNSQYSFTKGKPCLTNLWSSMMGLQLWWKETEQLTLSTWISAKCSTQSCMPSLSFY